MAAYFDAPRTVQERAKHLVCPQESRDQSCPPFHLTETFRRWLLMILYEDSDTVIHAPWVSDMHMWRLPDDGLRARSRTRETVISFFLLPI